MKISIIITTATFLLLFSRCSKNDLINNNNPLIGKLKSISYRESIWTSTTYQDFQYDAIGRVSEMNQYSKGDNGTIVPIIKVFFFYTSSNQTPDSLISLNPPKMVHILSYDLAKRLTIDSVRRIISPIPLINKMSYSYTDNSSIGQYPDSFISTSDYYDSTITNNDNLVFYKKVYQDLDSVVNEYEYDNKLNPIHTLNIAQVYHVLNGDRSYFSFYDLTSSKNNLIRKKSTYRNNSVATNYTNTYNSADIITKIHHFNQGVTKEIFFLYH